MCCSVLPGKRTDCRDPSASASPFRPDTTKVWNFLKNFRDAGPHWVSFPQHFKNNNYTALGSGEFRCGQRAVILLTPPQTPRVDRSSYNHDQGFSKLTARRP